MTHIHTSRPTGGLAFDWAMAALSAIFIGGLYLDGWAHTHGRVDDTFFTPWHAVLYSGYAATTLFLVARFVWSVAAGHSWHRALPWGYGLSLLGSALWFIGGPGDLLWHELFGFEAGAEALLSPPHLVLALGGALIVGGPLRAAWRRGEGRGWHAWLPALLSLTFVLSVLTFFTQIAHPIANLWGRGSAPVAHVQQELGVVSILLTSALLSGVVLLALRRQPTPLGSFTLVFTLNAGAMGVLYDKGPYPITAVAAFALGGVAADLLRLVFRPAPDRPVAWRLYAFAVPTVLYLLYFLALFGTEGLAWSAHLWIGTIAFSGIAGWLLSYLVVPPGGPKVAYGTL